MPKICLTFVLILILGNALFAQDTAKRKEYVLPSDIQAILLEAGTLSPELTVDIDLKLISSGKIESKSKRKQLLEEAFYLSFNAKEKVRRKVISFSGQVIDNRSTFLSNAQNNKLDALSLQIRTVSEMLKIDRVHAFELFNEIPSNLFLKPLSCQDFLLYETSDFYDLVGEIAKNSFTPEQIKQGRRIAFLSKYIESINSTSQILPVVKMLSSVDLTDDEKLNLISQFAKSIRKISGDDRSFSYAMNFAQTNRAIYDFSRKLFYSPPLYDEFRKSYRDYLVRNLQGIRCQDNVELEKIRGKATEDAENVVPNTELPFYVYEINKVFYNDSPITVEETKFSDIEKTTFPIEYFTSPKERQNFDKFRELQNSEDENKTISEIKETLEWQQAFSKLTDEIDEWEKTDNENTIDLFHQKSLAFRLFLKEAPTFAFKETIVKKYLKLLDQNEIQKDFASEWFLEFSDLRKAISEIEYKEQQQKLVDVLSNSNNSAVRVYLDLEKILKPEAKAVTASN